MEEEREDTRKGKRIKEKGSKKMKEGKGDVAKHSLKGHKFILKFICAVFNNKRTGHLVIIIVL